MTPIILALLLLISSASAIDINLNVSAEGNGYRISEGGLWSCIVTDPPAPSVPEMALLVTGPAEMYWGIPANLTVNITNVGKCNLENISASLGGGNKSDYSGIIEPGASAEIDIPVVVNEEMVTLNYQVAATGDDGRWTPYSGFDASQLLVGNGTSAIYHSFARWGNVTIPDDASITAAYVTVMLIEKTGTGQLGTLYFCDAADPSAPANESQADALALTSNSIPWNPPSGSIYTSYNSGDISDILNELRASNSYALGAAMMMIWKDNGSSANNYSRFAEKSNGFGVATLHIEYTIPSVGIPLNTARKRIANALLVR